MREKGDARAAPARAATTSDYLYRWLAVFVKPNRSFSTHRQYEQVIRNYLAPAIGTVPLCKLSVFDCQEALNDLLARVSARTVDLTRTILIRALGDAVKNGLLTANPALATYRPKVRAPRMRALKSEHCERLIGVLGSDTHSLVIKFLLATGLRISEALGAQWEDLAGASLRVERRLEWTGQGRWRFSPLKTRKSRRCVPLGSLACEVLEELRLRSKQASGLIFQSTTGKPLWARNIQRSLDASLRRAALPHFSLHDLRRTCATLLAIQGTPVHIVQALLGHESVLTTLTHYQSVFAEDLERAMAGLDFRVQVSASKATKEEASEVA